jgi:ketosteroid isomerase-like protein
MLAPLLVAATGCGARARTAADEAADRAALMKLDADFSRASVERGMAEAFRAYLAADAKSFPQGGLMVTGRDAIVAEMVEPADGPRATLRWEPAGADVARSGELGYTYVTFEFERVGPDGVKLVKHGKYVSIWRRTAEGWKLAVDIGNGSP